MCSLHQNEYYKHSKMSIIENLPQLYIEYYRPFELELQLNKQYFARERVQYHSKTTR